VYSGDGFDPAGRRVALSGVVDQSFRSSGAEQHAGIVSHNPVHLDAHPIPANPAEGEPAHRHFDFRFLFRASTDVGQLQAEEVTAAAWRGLHEIENEVLRDRVLAALN
jgi:hypothetical protein